RLTGVQKSLFIDEATRVGTDDSFDHLWSARGGRVRSGLKSLRSCRSASCVPVARPPRPPVRLPQLGAIITSDPPLARRKSGLCPLSVADTYLRAGRSPAAGSLPERRVPELAAQ